jgi:hypothetical protein
MNWQPSHFFKTVVLKRQSMYNWVTATGIVQDLHLIPFSFHIKGNLKPGSKIIKVLHEVQNCY